MSVATVPESLAWVDEFIGNVRPYIFVREEDSLLIKRPNQAQKLNAKGVEILRALLSGRSIAEVLDEVGRDRQRMHDVSLFMFEVRRFLEGTLTETNATHAVEVRPFDMRFSRLPILSEIALTYRCNLKCEFCYAGCNCTVNPAGSTREMTTQEAKEALRRIRHQAKVPSVSFTGGEATLREDLPELIREAKALDMRVNLITNGTRVAARELADAGLDSAQVSLEGVTAATHDGVTSVPGSFERTLAGIEAIKATGIHVHTNSTIHRGNLDECLKMPAFVRDRLGLSKFSMNLVIPSGSAALNERLVVRYSEIGPVLEKIREESRRAGVEFMWYSPTPMCVFNPIGHGLGNKGCSACDGLISVAPNGDVLPCPSYDDPVGNLLERPVGEIWESPKARAYRAKEFAHPGCKQCEDFQVCHGACPLYWRHLGYDELEALP
jgi:radical SAM protein with 4Fe4S-binding SPASM domain